MSKNNYTRKNNSRLIGGFKPTTSPSEAWSKYLLNIINKVKENIENQKYVNPSQLEIAYQNAKNETQLAMQQLRQETKSGDISKKKSELTTALKKENLALKELKREKEALATKALIDTQGKTSSDKPKFVFKSYSRMINFEDEKDIVLKNAIIEGVASETNVFLSKFITQNNRL